MKMATTVFGDGLRVSGTSARDPERARPAGTRTRVRRVAHGSLRRMGRCPRLGLSHGQQLTALGNGVIRAKRPQRSGCCAHEPGIGFTGSRSTSH